MKMYALHGAKKEDMLCAYFNIIMVVAPSGSQIFQQTNRQRQVSSSISQWQASRHHAEKAMGREADGQAGKHVCKSTS